MRAMLEQTVHLQWKVTRWALVPFIVLGFGLPLMALRSADAMAGRHGFAAGMAFLGGQQMFVGVFPLAAATLGITVGLAAWSYDHRSNHVYPLSLPIGRWEYALLKFVAGLPLLLVPAAAVLLGVLLGLWTIDVPEGLHAYPFAFAFRFVLLATVVYAATFAIASATMRTAIGVLSTFLVFLIGGTLVVGFARESLGMEDLITPIELMEAALLEWPGPFHVAGGNWMIVDV